MFSTPASLLERLRQPDEVSAWDRFAELYAPLLFHWARRFGQQDSDAADLVQDVFLLLLKSLPDFDYDPARSFHGWLKTVFLNRLRSRRRGPAVAGLDGTGFEPADEVPTDFDDPEYRDYLIRQAFRLIEREFAPLHQQVFRAYVLEEQAPEAVAAAAGLSIGTVYAIKSKVLTRLRQELRDLL